MKRGLIVARRRFWNKYGNSISNGFFVFSIILFGAMFALNVYGNPFAKEEAKANSNIVSETKEIVNIEGDTITTNDNMVYVMSDIEEKVQIYDNQEVKLELLVVNENPVNVIAVYK